MGIEKIEYTEEEIERMESKKREEREILEKVQYELQETDEYGMKDVKFHEINPDFSTIRQILDESKSPEEIYEEAVLMLKSLSAILD